MTIFCPPAQWVTYVVSVFAIAVAIRVFLSSLRYWPEKTKYSFKHICRGYGAGNEVDDYLLPAIVGLLELLVYPVLLAAGKPEYIGAWLGFKVVPKLGLWSAQRETYQRFLIGNALTIISSYVLQVCFYSFPC